MARVVVRPAARRGLTRHFAYLVENAGLEVARRFRDSARTTFDGLAKMPEMGSPRNIGRFTDLRMWRVRGFEKHLIFDRSLRDRIQIERVIHAAQDYTRVLARSKR